MPLSAKGKLMSELFKELAYTQTPIGEISLRRRRQLSLDVDVYEIKIDDNFLMSSLFTKAEEELANLGLAPLADKSGLEVVIGGLGLGYTAQAALAHDNVGELIVVEAIQPVIDWHHEGLMPLGAELSADERCRMVQGDFFALSKGAGFDPDNAGRQFDAVLLDIDHAPDYTLHDSHGWFYTKDGLARLAEHLKPGGVFALWSNDPPEDGFMEKLAAVFDDAQGHVITFPNPLRDCDETNSVYVARKRQ